MWVPADPATALHRFSQEVMMASCPPLRRKRNTDSTLGPMFPGGKWPARDLIGHTQARLVEFDHPREVNGSGNQDQIARSVVDGLFQFMPLHGAVAHGWQQIGQVRVAFVGAADGADGIRPRINQLGRATPSCCDYTCSVGHLAVSQ